MNKAQQISLLYRVSFVVRLAPTHPLFYEAGDGCFSIWLFADSPDQAAMRAASIINQLPYEIKDGMAHVLDSCNDTEAISKPNEEIARQAGLAFSLGCVPLEAAIPDIEQNPHNL